MDPAIHLLRHGRIKGFEARRYIGRSDVLLDEEGLRQAALWRQRFGPGRFGRILCSDLRRSLDTARILAGQETEPEILTALREIDLGAWDGLARAEVRDRFPDQYAARGRDMARYRPPGGESFQDLAARVIPAFEALARQARGDVLVVGHAGVNRVILCHVLGLPLENLFCLGQDYAGLSVIQWTDQGPLLRGLNLTPAL